MKHLYFFVASLCLAVAANAQNLVPNPGFEQYSSCPQGVNTGYGHTCSTWLNGNKQTPDYYNSCNNSINGIAGVPSNISGYQAASGGNGYMGIFLYNTAGIDVKEYIAAPIPALEAGESYRVSVDVSLAGSSSVAANGFGVLFYKNGIANYDTAVKGNTIPVAPQVDFIHYGILKDTVNWTTLVDTFTADSAYTMMVFGGFIPQLQMDTTRFNNNTWQQAYYYVDNIKVESLTSLGVVNNNRAPAPALYPNPLTDRAELKYAHTVNGPYELLIYNTTGQLVKCITGNNAAPIYIDREGMAQGLYYYRLTDATTKLTGKLLVQ